MKTFVLAPDSFKESMTAEQACRAMQRGIQLVIADAQCIHVPMADGGEGTVDAFVHALNGFKVACVVQGPLAHQRVQTYFGLVDHGQTAILEMAKANGIDLLKKEERNPLLTSTFGTGEMIRQALDCGVKKIIIGLGGSVTNDGGSGMAQALGVKFLDDIGCVVHARGGVLNQIAKIDLTKLDSRLKDVEIIIASDVNNPLCGEQGATAVFGPQKGASSAMVEQLEVGLQHYATLVEKSTLNVDMQNVAGAGAAGGLGFGLMAFANAKIQSGANLVIEQTGLAEKIAKADFVFTGEGSIDFQTKFGKTPWAVAQVAKQFNKPVYAFAGRVGDDVEPLLDEGFTQIVSINELNCDLEAAMQNAEINLEKSVREIIENII